MKDWPFMRGDTEAELERADDLLDKADALLRRHRGADPEPAPDTLPGNDTDIVMSLEDEDDLPILTDIVEDFDLAVPVLSEVVAPSAPDAAAAAHPAAASPAPAPEPADIDRARIAEQLIEIDTEVSREVEAWLANELPQILSRELDALVEKVRSETLAHLRATLLPTLSERIARRLDQLDD